MGEDRKQEDLLLLMGESIMELRGSVDGLRKVLQELRFSPRKASFVRLYMMLQGISDLLEGLGGAVASPAFAWPADVDRLYEGYAELSHAWSEFFEICADVVGDLPEGALAGLYSNLRQMDRDLAAVARHAVRQREGPA